MKRTLLLLPICMACMTIFGQDTQPKDTTEAVAPIYTITTLTKIADSARYGFIPALPVKVGIGPKGGPANQRAYLDLLRDAQGKPVTYSRSGSCCMYPSKYGLMGYGMLDMYVISFRDEANNKKRAIVYITFYDYEEPMVLYGFASPGVIKQ